MALVYFDTSALVKLCVLETGSPLVVALWQGADALVTSRLADTEVASVLSAAERIGRIDAAPAAQARELWHDLRDSLTTVEVTPTVTEHASTLASKRPLRAADAIHLASALVLRDAELLFAAWDRRLSSAARAEGLVVLPPALA